jgi:hypothetical protein
MSDDESDVAYSDVADDESPLSQSFSAGRGQSISRHTSNDRLYSSSSRHLSIVDHHTPLLSQADGRAQYLAVPASEGESSRPLGMVTRKISRVFQAKSFDYDIDKSSLAAVGSGERVWYLLFGQC